MKKTECLWIGSRSSSTDIYPSEKPIKLANKKVYALGTWFSTVNEHMQINFSDRFEKMKNILNSWLRIFTELVMNSARIEKRFAFETNALGKFETKWSRLDSFLFSR